MSNWNPLEQRLRSWTPRSPSAGLRARLFPDAESVAVETNPFDGRWGWLAPVMGCCLALMVVSSSRHPPLPPQGTDWLATVASNQSYAAYVAAGFHTGQNTVHRDLIEWTNGAPLTSPPSPVRSAATNNLIR